MGVLNIMVVEDSGIVLLDIEKSLKSLGYTVAATASSKKEAIQKAETTRPDLVLMDIRLGEEMGGIEAADYIREHFDIPIVFLTGYADEDTFQRAKITDPFGYILKPFDPKGLRTTIEIALHNHALKKKLRESEERYRALVELSPEAVFVHREGRFIYSNQAGVDMMGASHPDELVGTPIKDRIHPDFRKKVQERVQKSLSNGKAAPSLDEVFVRMDGSPMDVEVVATPISYEGQPAMLTVVRDITERKQAEQALKESRERYRLVADYTYAWEFWVDPQGVIIYNSPSCKEVSGYEADEFKTLDDFKRIVFPGEEHLLDHTLDGRDGSVHTSEFRINTKSGEMRFIEHVCRPVHNQEGEYLGRRGSNRDITERNQAEAALQESEARLLEAQHLARLGNWEWELADQSLAWSDEVFRIFGYLPGEIEASVEIFEGAIHPDDREGFLRQREQMLAEGTPTAFDHRIILPDGRVRYVQERSQLVREDWGEVCRVIGTVQDVTEQMEAEAALQETEALYHDLVETAQDLIWQCDIEGRYTYLNPAWEDVFGYKVEEMLGKPFAEFQNVEHAVRDQEQFARLLQGGTLNGYETTHLAKDGRELQLVFNAKSVLDQDGNAIGTRGTAYDITERKQNEDALKKSEYLLQESQKIARQGHYDLDIPSGQWRSSDGLNELFGIDWDFQSDVEGWLQITHPDDREMMAAYFAEEVLGKGQNFDKEYRIARIDDGEMRWVHGLGRLEIDDDGNPIRMIGNIQDVTERKKSEETLRESEVRMRRLASAAHEGIVFTENGKVVEANEQLARILGCELPELIGNSAMDFVAPESHSLVMEKIQSGSEELYEHLALRKDGTIIPVEVQARMLIIQGQSMRVTAIRDITEKQQAELARQESERRFREALENVQLVAVSLDRQGNVTFCNDYLLDLVGWTREELLGKNWFDTCLSPDVSETVREMFVETIESETMPGHYENEIVTRSGERRLVVWNNTMLRDIQGRVVGTTSIGEDITERRLADAALQAKTGELEALFSISTHLRMSQSVDSMLPVVLEEMRRVFHSDANAVLLLEPDGQHFTYAMGDGSLASNTGNQFSVEKSISGLILKTGQPYQTDDFSSDKTKTDHLLGSANLGPALLAPVHSETEFLGVLLCARDKDSPLTRFERSELQLLKTIGEMVGNAMRRARLYEDALTRLRHVQALHSIDMAITANMDLRVVLEVLLTQGVSQLDVDAACILLLDQSTHTLDFAAGHGFRTQAVETARVRLGEGLSGLAVLQREVIYNSDIRQSEQLARTSILDEGFVSYQVAPLVSKGQLQGVLEVFYRQQIMPSEENIDFLETLATQAAIAIDNAQLFGNLQRSNFELELAYDATIEGWSHALELRDQETEGHTLRVTEMTLKLARAVGIRQDEIANIRRGALLHDIGKMGVPDSILLKPDKLTPAEWERMKKHTEYAFEMLWPINFLREAIDIPHYHHEKWDGTGYPRGLKDEQIPLAARVFAVADVWDALINDRPYRKAWSREKALSYIRENVGKHFDPSIVEKFLGLIDVNGKN